MNPPRLPVFLASSLLLASVAFAAADHPVVPLWANGAPGSEARKSEPEKVAGSNVSNVHNPSLTVYLPPKDRATGVAVIVAPGGGHQRHAIQHEVPFHASPQARPELTKDNAL